MTDKLIVIHYSTDPDDNEEVEGTEVSELEYQELLNLQPGDPYRSRFHEFPLLVIGVRSRKQTHHIYMRPQG